VFRASLALALTLGLALALGACGQISVVAPEATTTASATSSPYSGPHGTITGDVVAGPTCPVEHAEDPCADRPVPDRQVTITTSGSTPPNVPPPNAAPYTAQTTPTAPPAASTTTDANGHFSVDVPPGSYVVRVAAGLGLLGMRQITPGNVTIAAGQTTYIKIELDTGIR
jgi:hypothetical protein